MNPILISNTIEEMLEGFEIINLPAEMQNTSSEFFPEHKETILVYGYINYEGTLCSLREDNEGIWAVPAVPESLEFLIAYGEEDDWWFTLFIEGGLTGWITLKSDKHEKIMFSDYTLGDAVEDYINEIKKTRK